MNHYRISLTLLFAFATRCGVVAVQEGTPAPDINEIRGGSNLNTAIPYYAVFADNTLCGGVLINTDIVLTTASCLDNGNIPSQVRVGSLDRTSGGALVGVLNVRFHPDWNGDVVQGNDIAVMRIGGNLTNDLASLNTAGNAPREGEGLFVMGFGQVDDNSLPGTLKGLTYDYLQSCQPKFGGYNPTAHLCAAATPTKGTCGGDGGSPAVLSGSSVVVGLSSFSDGLCENQSFDVYTRVSSYVDWVQSEVCAISLRPPSSCSASPCLFFTPFLSGVFDAGHSMARFLGF